MAASTALIERKKLHAINLPGIELLKPNEIDLTTQLLLHTILPAPVEQNKNDAIRTHTQTLWSVFALA